MKNHRWDTTFRELFDRCCGRYRSGDGNFADYYTDEDSAFLQSIGCRPREFFDFVEDHCDRDGIPSAETALLVAAARRDYFLVEQKGQWSEPTLTSSDLPARDSELGGYTWLPRILAKARAKLRGELDPEVMYGCGGDTGFLSTHDLHPADFLRATWAAGDDEKKLVAWIKG